MSGGERRLKCVRPVIRNETSKEGNGYINLRKKIRGEGRKPAGAKAQCQVNKKLIKDPSSDYGAAA